MSLFDIWKADKASIQQMSIRQITAIAGDGKVRDNSLCQEELRSYFKEATSDSLASYANYCLEQPFEGSGYVLQDVVNELGRRLEYSVENGRYRGIHNAIGYDGIWDDGDGFSIVVEVKTTDAYRMSLNTVAGYRKALIEEGRISEHSSVLIVVGRTDTGELEAQVRGSKHAWDIRIIGIDSLIQLVRIKESAENPETIRKIRTLLRPVEYTRIDELVDVVFAATKDVEEADEEMDADNIEKVSKSTHSINKTPSTVINAVRGQIIEAISKQREVVLIKKTRSMYWSPDHTTRIMCTVSKRYENKSSAKYWYVYHPQWTEFLQEGTHAFLALGCVDLEIAFLLPLEKVKEVLPKLNTTVKEDGSVLWHLKITEPQTGAYHLQIPSGDQDLPLSEYVLSIEERS